MKRLAFVAALFLAVPSAFAAANLTIKITDVTPVIRAGTQTTFRLAVQNIGSDPAVNVQVRVSSSQPGICCDANLGTLLPFANPVTVAGLVEAPRTAGPVTVTATAASSTPDSDPGDNTVTQTFTVSIDPDLEVKLLGPFTQDPGKPFPLMISLTNLASFVAHDVEVTLDFPPEVGIQGLDNGCSSPAAGRIVCRANAVPDLSATTNFQLTLVVPVGYPEASLVFTATATERESDFDPASNRATFALTVSDVIYVTTTADDGPGSLRRALGEANTVCLVRPTCTIAFRIAEQTASAVPWKTIRVTSPLPPITAYRLRIEGATQHSLVGTNNPSGPEIELTGGGTIDGDGLVVTTCSAEIANLAINGFGGNGISVHPACAQGGARLHDLYIGTDPTGILARPNHRGIGILAPNGTTYITAGAETQIGNCLISGNLRSGIFALSGRINVFDSRIGVTARVDEPLPNGGSGIYVGLGGFGGAISGNVIAYNGEMGIAVAAGVTEVSVTGTRLWGNGGLGIDVGLDGPTPVSNVVSSPVLTLAHYDPASGETVIEGDYAGPLSSTLGAGITLYANDAADPSGYGEAQRILGGLKADNKLPAHFRFAVKGDLTGQFITATATRENFIGIEGTVKAAGIGNAFLTQTSEISRAIEVR